jgi:putative spermidine/putrescine transport system substrate-binding protein
MAGQQDREINMTRTLWPAHDPEFTRRMLLRLGALAGANSVLASIPGGASAAGSEFAGKSVTFASWGGSFQDAQAACYCAPFAAATGAKVLQAGPVEYAKLRTMVQSGQPVWDLVDITIEFLYTASKDGLFEKIDPAVAHVDRVKPEFRHEYGVGDIVWSYNIAYSSAAFPDEKGPQNWADVFDVARFPGTRTLRDRVAPMLEIALMADGVAPDKLYPLDVDRAFRKLDTIKKNTIWWTTNSQPQQLFTDGEVSCGLILNGRAYDAVQKGAKLTLVWNQNIQSVDYLVIPKGSRNRDVAMGLIGEMTVAENQAKLASLIAYSPTNPDAFKTIDPAISPWLSTNPENANKGFVINAEYWRDQYENLAERWQTWKLS